MTDDTILLLIITAVLAIATLVMYFGIKRSMRKAEEARLKRERALEQLKAEREASWKRMAGQTYYKSTPPTTTAVDNKSSSSKTYYAPQSSSSTDSDDLITAIILNQALNSNSGVVSARVDYTDNSVTVTEEPVQSYPKSSWDSIGSSSSSSSSSDDVGSSSSWSKSSSSWSSSSSDIGSSSSWDSSSSSDSGSSSSWD